MRAIVAAFCVLTFAGADSAGPKPAAAGASLLEAFLRGAQREAKRSAEPGAPPGGVDDRPTMGLPFNALNSDVDMAGKFNGSMMPEILAEPVEMPWSMSTPESDKNNTFNARGEWDGMYFDKTDSTTQSERRLKGGGQLKDIAETLGKYVMDLGDDDYTKFYANFVDKKNNKYMHFLKKKEVVKMYSWLTARMDKMRERLVNHFAATDMFMYKLTSFFDDVNNLDMSVAEKVADFLEDAAMYSQHMLKMVDNRVKNARNAFPNTTDKQWIKDLTKDVTTLNTSVMEYGDKLYKNMTDLTNQAYLEFTNINDAYTMFNRSAVDDVTDWYRNYRTLTKGVINRIFHETDRNTEDLGDFIRHFRIDEMQQQLEWFKSFMLAFRAIQSKASFINVATKLTGKSLKRLRRQMDKTKDKYYTRVDNFNEQQEKGIDVFKTDVDEYVTGIGGRVNDMVSDGMKALTKEINDTLQVVSAQLELKIEKVGSRAEGELDADPIKTRRDSSYRTLRANLSTQEHRLKLLPRMSTLQTKVDELGDPLNGFFSRLESNIIQPRMLDLQKFITDQRAAYFSTMRTRKSRQEQDMSGLYKNTTQEIELHSNALQASLDGLKRLARAIELKRSNLITLAHGMSAPSLDELWTKFRQVQRAAKGMAKRSMLLQQEVVSFENQSAPHLESSVNVDDVRRAGGAVLGDWHTMAKEGTVAFLQKLHELNFPVPDTSPPGNFRQVGQPVHIKPMLQNIENASDVLASFAQSFSETIANRSEAEGAALTHAIQDACDRYLRFVDRALKIAPLGAQLVEAQQWLNRTRMTIPSEVPSMAQAKEAYNDLEAKFDNVSAAQTATANTADGAVRKLSDEMELFDDLIARREVLSGVRLRRLADHVEQWAHNLPEPKPLNARLTVEDVQIPPPIVDLPGLDDLGLNETSVSHLDGDVAAVKQHADLAHADHVSGLLEQAEAIGLLTAEDARQQDAGEILLGDALSDGRKATFKAPHRRDFTHALSALSTLEESAHDAVNTYLNGDHATPQQVERWVLPDTAKVETALKSLHFQNLGQEAVKQEDELDRVEERLRPVVTGPAARELAELSREPNVIDNVLPELVNESSSVQSRLRQRISDGFARGKEQMGQLVDKMQGSLRDVVASIARQDSRLHGSVSQLGARVDSIANATRRVEASEKDAETTDEALQDRLEKEIDNLPTFRFESNAARDAKVARLEMAANISSPPAQ